MWPSYWREVLLYVKLISKHVALGENFTALFDAMSSLVSEPYQEQVNGLVLNRYKDSTKDLPLPLVNIMRPGPYGNPYSHQSGARIAPQFAVATREAAVLSYLLELRLAKPEFISELKGKYLLCCCAPSLCHGHILAALANNNGETNDYQALIDKWLTDAVLIVVKSNARFLNKGYLNWINKETLMKNPHYNDPMFAFKVI